MKSKGKNLTPSNHNINESSINSSNSSENMSFNENKKKKANKYSSRNYSKRPKNRQNNSLDELTKRFIRCIYELGNEKINLNIVMKKIKAKKRRIYDITNVLEGN
jgi:hypothetical protein